MEPVHFAGSFVVGFVDALAANSVDTPMDENSGSGGRSGLPPNRYEAGDT